MTLRIKFGKKKGELESINQNVVKNIYNVTLKDVGIRGFFLLKHQKKNVMEFMASDCFVADKIKGEVVLLSTSLTVLRSESEDNFTVESLELS